MGITALYDKMNDQLFMWLMQIMITPHPKYFHLQGVKYSHAKEKPINITEENL